MLRCASSCPSFSVNTRSTWCGYTRCNDATCCEDLLHTCFRFTGQSAGIENLAGKINEYMYVSVDISTSKIKSQNCSFLQVCGSVELHLPPQLSASRLLGHARQDLALPPAPKAFAMQCSDAVIAWCCVSKSAINIEFANTSA